MQDYEGDGSTAGSFASFPCDSNPAPNSTWPNITSAILNPGPTLNPGGIGLATGIWSNGTVPSYTRSYAGTKTIVKPWMTTTYVCPAGSSETVAIIHSLSNGIPVTATSTVGAAGSTAAPSVVNVIYTTTINGVAATETSTSSISGAASGSSGLVGTSAPATFTGGASSLGGSLAAVGLGAVIAIVLLS